MLLQLPVVFPDTLASSCGECDAVSAADQAASAGSFAPGLSLLMCVHRLQSVHCRSYVPTTAHRHKLVYTTTQTTPLTIKNVPPNFSPYLCQILTDFCNSFTGTQKNL